MRNVPWVYMNDIPRKGFVVGKHTGDCGSWTTAVVRWWPLRTSFTPTPPSAPSTFPPCPSVYYPRYKHNIFLLGHIAEARTLSGNSAQGCC